MTLTKEQLLALSEKPKDFLRSAYLVEEKINAKYEQIAKWRSVLEKCTTEIKETTNFTGYSENKLETGVLNIIEVEEEIQIQIAELRNLQVFVELAIKLTADPTYQLLLELRYIQGLDFYTISEKMQYSYSWIRRVHGKALKSVQRESLSQLNNL